MSDRKVPPGGGIVIAVVFGVVFWTVVIALATM
jgi:hypothetical protein